MKMVRSLGHVVGGALLIAATTIGVGMLALPVATGPGGFLPSMAIYLVCWVFMLCTGLLLVEVSLSMPKETSFISMAQKLLGPVGRALFWVVYLFLFITVMVAHSAGGGKVLIDITGLALPNWLAIIFYTSIFVPVIYLGASTVERLNLYLIAGVVLCYLSFIAVSCTQVNLQLLAYGDWGKAWVALPVLFTAFTYQVIVPTLMTYMERNVKKVRLAIFIGTSIPLVIYLIWEFLILGIVPPDGPGGLIEAGKLGQNAVAPLKEFVGSPYVFQIGKFFAFFALTTSFIPFALSFFDFMADGLKWEKKGIRRVVLCLGIFGIPLIIALIYPNIFLVALGYAGGISCALLFGLMPPLMAWVSRYIKHDPKASRQLPGGKPVLILLMAFAILILVGEVIQQMN